MGFGFTKPIFMLIKKAIARRGYLILTSGRTANQRIAFISSFFFKYSSSNLAFVYTGYNALYTDFCYYNLERVNLIWKSIWMWQENEILPLPIQAPPSVWSSYMRSYTKCITVTQTTPFLFLFPKPPKNHSFKLLVPTSIVIWSSSAHVL